MLRGRLPVAEPRPARAAARGARRRRAGHARQPRLRPDRARSRRSSRCDAGPDGSWFVDPRRAGGILFELASHDIDLQCAIAGPVGIGRGVVRVGPPGARRRRRATGLDDAVALTLRFASGALGSVLVAWTEAQEPPVYTLDLLTTEIALQLRCEPLFQLEGQARGVHVREQGTIDPRESTLDRFFEAVRAGDRGACRARPSMRSARLRPRWRARSRSWAVLRSRWRRSRVAATPSVAAIFHNCDLAGDRAKGAVVDPAAGRINLLISPGTEPSVPRAD